MRSVPRKMNTREYVVILLLCLYSSVNGKIVRRSPQAPFNARNIVEGLANNFAQNLAGNLAQTAQNVQGILNNVNNGNRNPLGGALGFFNFGTSFGQYPNNQNQGNFGQNQGNFGQNPGNNNFEQNPGNNNFGQNPGNNFPGPNGGNQGPPPFNQGNQRPPPFNQGNQGPPPFNQGNQGPPHQHGHHGPPPHHHGPPPHHHRPPPPHNQNNNEDSDEDKPIFVDGPKNEDPDKTLITGYLDNNFPIIPLTKNEIRR